MRYENPGTQIQLSAKVCPLFLQVRISEVYLRYHVLCLMTLLCIVSLSSGYLGRSLDAYSSFSPHQLKKRPSARLQAMLVMIPIQTPGMVAGLILYTRLIALRILFDV